MTNVRDEPKAVTGGTSLDFLVVRTPLHHH